MSHTITVDCNKCEACIEECPTECIYLGDDQAYVDTDSCIDCGACLNVCPQACIIVTKIEKQKKIHEEET